MGNTQHKFYVGCRTSYLNKISSVRYLNWSRKLPGGWLLLSCPPRPRHGPRRARTSGGRSGVRCPHGSGFLLLQVGTLRPGGNGRNGLDSALATSYRSPRPHILSFHPSFLPVCFFPLKTLSALVRERACVLSSAQLCDPMDCSPPGSSVQWFSRKESWSELPFPFPGDLPNQGLNPGPLH